MSTVSTPATGFHAGQPVLHSGEPVESAHAALILIHGRGAGAGDILGLSGALNLPGWAFLAPQAAGFTWYPNRFMASLHSNEPWLSSALSVLGSLVSEMEAGGIPGERIGLLGFSQGACLALEYAARNPRRYAGLFGLSGGLIGPDPQVQPGSLAGTPVFLGCSDVDPHIPKDRVEESARILTEMGGQVDLRLYPGMGHLVNDDEIQAVQGILAQSS